MKLIFLGAGDAFTVGEGNFQSNMLLESPNGRRMLIDCGTDVRQSLFSLGLVANDISDIFISHLHSDHVGGLEWFALKRMFFKPTDGKPALHISKDLAKDLWNKVLQGGLDTLENDSTNLETYFIVDLINDREFSWEGITFELIPVLHVYAGTRPAPCYGLIFTYNTTTVMISSDTRFTPDVLMPYYNRADLIFHDCETSVNKSGVHSHYTELTTLPMPIKNKMWLYHYSSNFPIPNAESDGFSGMVVKGQEFEL